MPSESDARSDAGLVLQWQCCFSFVCSVHGRYSIYYGIYSIYYGIYYCATVSTTTEIEIDTVYARQPGRLCFLSNTPLRVCLMSTPLVGWLVMSTSLLSCCLMHIPLILLLLPPGWLASRVRSSSGALE